MGIILFAATIFLVLINITEGNPSASTYYEYAKENVSINVVDLSLTWQQARDWCAGDDAGLVQVFDEDKVAFLRAKGEEVSGQNNQFWIGVSDLDMDGMYEYVNGTKLKTKMPGLGKWANGTALNPKIKQKKLCVTLEMIQGPWKSVPCSEKQSLFFCEKPVRPMSTQVAVGACTLEECTCNKEDWHVYGPGQIYFKVNRIAKDFATSASICENLGGELLKVPNKATETFIRNDMSVSWIPMGVLYWMGLSAINGPWNWIDRTRLMQSDYKNWFDDLDSRTGCVAAVWDYWGKWRITDCSHEHYQVCEATEPCSAHPVLIIDETMRPNSVSVQMTNDQESTVKCDIKGYAGFVKEVKVTCDLGWGVIGKYNRLEEMTVPINITIHDKPCVCQLTFDDGTTDETRIVFKFKTRPRLVHDYNRTANTLYTRYGHKVVLKFEIYANPKPRVFELWTNGSQTSPSEYLVMVKRLNKPLYYKVTIEFKHRFSSKMVANYTLWLDNGIPERLAYVFALKRKSEAKSSYAYLLYVYIITPSILLFLIVAGLLILRMSRKAKEKRKSLAQIKLQKEEAEDEGSFVFEPQNIPESVGHLQFVKDIGGVPVTEPVVRYGRYKSVVLY